MPRLYIVLTAFAAFVLAVSTAPAGAGERPLILAAGTADNQMTALAQEPKLTPEQKMQKRMPQPVRVGDLIGLPVLDEDDSTIGYVSDVVRSPQGKVMLIVPYSAWFGWARTDWGKRPVAVPIEVVAILARQIDTLDMDRGDFDKAPTFAVASAQSVPRNEKTLIALGRR